LRFLISPFLSHPAGPDSPPELITVPSSEPTPEKIDRVAETLVNALDYMENVDPAWEDMLCLR
jgi:hypothetical protein